MNLFLNNIVERKNLEREVKKTMYLFEKTIISREISGKR